MISDKFMQNEENFSASQEYRFESTTHSLFRFSLFLDTPLSLLTLFFCFLPPPLSSIAILFTSSFFATILFLFIHFTPVSFSKNELAIHVYVISDFLNLSLSFTFLCQSSYLSLQSPRYFHSIRLSLLFFVFISLHLPLIITLSLSLSLSFQSSSFLSLPFSF
ncbi:unnamed protein product [Acanthosepion pharaonis]|uniref:Uncharacterized protein n=1 Tax=Acanthosepion pharaonis TaxID=158019 RepID=A0A812CPF4_ACAPH|nr:unnamed protein product [Sepia pharaonis]